MKVIHYLFFNKITSLSSLISTNFLWVFNIKASARPCDLSRVPGPIDAGAGWSLLGSQDPDPWASSPSTVRPLPPGQDLGLAQLEGPTTPTPGAVLSGGKPWLSVWGPTGVVPKGMTWGSDLPVSQEPLLQAASLLPYYYVTKVKCWSSSLGARQDSLKEGAPPFCPAKEEVTWDLDFTSLGGYTSSLLNQEGKFRVC